MKRHQNNGSVQRRLWLGDKPTRKVKRNIVFQGDNLEIMRELEPNKIDLIYIDPPFCSQAVYKSKAWGKKTIGFNDEWGGGIQSYIRWLVPRLRECHRLLSHTGSFFLHLDERSVHYAKSELDKIFGENNFINEIIWKRTSSNNANKNKLSVITDYILFYSKDKDKFKFKKLYCGHSDSYIKSHYSNKDKNGRAYLLDNLTSPLFNKNTQYTYKGYKPSKNGWRWSLKKMKEMDKKGYVYFPKDKNKRLRQIRYLDEQKGTPISNLWTDIFPVNSMAKERIGYPTQKPLNLLNRILELTTDKNDMVFDGFCGCGTTISSAQKLGRQWLGIDISKDAVSVIRKRMAKEHNLKIQVIKTGTLSRADTYSLNPFDFEHNMVKRIGGHSKYKKGR